MTPRARTWPNRWVLIATFALLAWRIAGSAAELGRMWTRGDVFGRSFQERIAAIDEPFDARLRHSLRLGSRVYDAILEHVPANGIVGLTQRGGEAEFKLVRALVSLTYPRRYASLEEVLPGKARSAPAGDRHGFVLTFAPNEEFPGQERCERLTITPRFSLWRVKPEAQ